MANTVSSQYKESCSRGFNIIDGKWSWSNKKDEVNKGSGTMKDDTELVLV